MKRTRATAVVISSLCLVIIIVSVFYSPSVWCQRSKSDNITDPYLVFTNKVYDTIEKYYWKNFSDIELANMYQESFKKVPFPVNSDGNYCNNKSGLDRHLEDIIKQASSTKNIGEENIREFIVDLNSYVVKNLSKEDDLSEIIGTKIALQRIDVAMNKAPEDDPYKDIGVKKDSSSQEISRQCEILAKSKVNSQQIRDCETLADVANKEVYDNSGAFRSVRGLSEKNMLYLQILVLSLNTTDEIDRYVNNYFGNTQSNDSYLVLDLRGNPGGYFDVMDNIINKFVGINHELYNVEGKIFNTPFLSSSMKSADPNYQKFKEVIIIIDENTKSATEVLAETMKKYSQTVVLGIPTKGEYGVSKNYHTINVSLSTSTEYSIWLVEGMIRRGDGELIHGNGVIPNIDIGKDGWRKELEAAVPSDVFQDILKILNQ